MKQTLSTERAVQLLLDDKNANWSLQGAIALVEHLEQLDEDMNTESEFDLIAIRCDYSEYESATEALSDYTSETVKDDDSAIELLQNETVVIQFKGGIIIQNF
mgnify:CR=1 FL=1